MRKGLALLVQLAVLQFAGRWSVAGASHYRVRQQNHEENLRKLWSFVQARLNFLARSTEGQTTPPR
jgi:hypothetical protein